MTAWECLHHTCAYVNEHLTAYPARNAFRTATSVYRAIAGHLTRPHGGCVQFVMQGTCTLEGMRGHRDLPTPPRTLAACSTCASSCGHAICGPFPWNTSGRCRTRSWEPRSNSCASSSGAWISGSRATWQGEEAGGGGQVAMGQCCVQLHQQLGWQLWGLDIRMQGHLGREVVGAGRSKIPHSAAGPEALGLRCQGPGSVKTQ